MSRSLLSQLEQIRGSVTYDDSVGDLYTSSVAEPTVSGTLEADLNVLRSFLKVTKGTTNWYDDLGTYANPTNTASGTQMSLSNIKGNTLDAATVIVSVSDDNSGVGYTVSGTSTGTLITTTNRYADTTNKIGMPIFASTANNGSYFDEGGTDNVCRVDVINKDTDSQILTSSGTLIYAKLHDAADFSGTGNGTDVYARFYTNDVVCDLSDTNGVSVNSVEFVYPYRKQMSTMNEYDWHRTDFVSGWEASAEVLDDITDLWSFTGSSDGETSPSWTNTTGNYPLSGNPSTLEGGVDDINDSIGDLTYTQDNYVTDGESIASSIDALDIALGALEAGTAEKYVYENPSLITANTEWSLPYGITYTPSSTAGREGNNMDVYLDGQLLAADTGVAGVNADRDYGETTTSGITFRFVVRANRNITLVVRQ